MSNRNIKFRVFNKELNRFVSSEEWFISLNGDLMFYSIGDGISLSSDKADKLIKVNKDLYIIQQYTGLNDMNNKEIYEGDIVKWDKFIPTGGYNTHNFEIISYINDNNRKDLSGFKLEIIGANRPFIQVCGSTKPRELEVIGNIFENLDLIK